MTIDSTAKKTRCGHTLIVALLSVRSRSQVLKRDCLPLQNYFRWTMRPGAPRELTMISIFTNMMSMARTLFTVTAKGVYIFN